MDPFFRYSPVTSEPSTVDADLSHQLEHYAFLVTDQLILAVDKPTQDRLIQLLCLLGNPPADRLDEA